MLNILFSIISSKIKQHLKSLVEQSKLIKIKNLVNLDFNNNNKVL